MCIPLRPEMLSCEKLGKKTSKVSNKQTGSRTNLYKPINKNSPHCLSHISLCSLHKIRKWSAIELLSRQVVRIQMPQMPNSKISKSKGLLPQQHAGCSRYQVHKGYRAEGLCHLNQCQRISGYLPHWNLL